MPGNILAQPDPAVPPSASWPRRNALMLSEGTGLHQLLWQLWVRTGLPVFLTLSHYPVVLFFVVIL